MNASDLPLIRAQPMGQHNRFPFFFLCAFIFVSQLWSLRDFTGGKEIRAEVVWRELSDI